MRGPEMLNPMPHCGPLQTNPNTHDTLNWSQDPTYFSRIPISGFLDHLDDCFSVDVVPVKRGVGDEGVQNIVQQSSWMFFGVKGLGFMAW